MKYALTGLALVALASAQGVPVPIFPNGATSPPTDNSNFPNNAFVLGTRPISDDPTQTSTLTAGVFNCDDASYSGAPRIALVGSALIDERGSTGCIVANDQFQFDGPPQNGVKISAGWTRNSTTGYLNLGGTTTFYNCLSGSFSNIYAATQGLQCKPVYITLQTCTKGSQGNYNKSPVNKPGTSPFQIPSVSTQQYIQNDPQQPNLGQVVGGSGPSSVPSSSAAASSTTSAASSSAAPVSSTPAPTPTSMSTMMAAPSLSVVPSSMPAPPMVMLPPQTQAAPVNGTTPAATGSPVAPSSTSTAKASPSPFVSSATAVSAGKGAAALLAVVAAAFAFA